MMIRVALLIIIVTLSFDIYSQHEHHHHLPKLHKNQFTPSLERSNIPSSISPSYHEKHIDNRIYSQNKNDSLRLYNLTGAHNSIHSAWVTFESNGIGVESFVYGIGSQPGTVNLRHYQTIPSYKRKTPSYSIQSLGINEGDTIYITMYTIRTDGTFTNSIKSDPIVMNWEDLGAQNNMIHIDFSDIGFNADGTIGSGWSIDHRQKLDHFTDRMLPIIKQIYGAPSGNQTFEFVRNQTHSGTFIFYPNENQIHMDTSFNYQLITHELIHAFHDDVLFSTDSLWNYDPAYSGYEEGFAQSVSYLCMNEYMRLYPQDVEIHLGQEWGSSKTWDYDFHNNEVLTTQDFWTASGGTGIAWARYEMSAALFEKAYIENNLFFLKYNEWYYQRLNDDHQKIVDKALLEQAMIDVVENIEGLETDIWIQRQRMLDCEVVEGFKIYPRIQHYNSHRDYWSFADVYYYQTFENGSEWATYNQQNASWQYYNLNGSEGLLEFYKSDMSLLEMRNIELSPIQNYPQVSQFGSYEFEVSNGNNYLPFPGGTLDSKILDVNENGLYQVDFTFDSASTSMYLVLGDSLQDFKGVYGGVVGIREGVVKLKHELFNDTSVFSVQNGMFYGQTSWSSFLDTNGHYNSIPGKVYFEFISLQGDTFSTTRNIGFGDAYSGNQLFLLDPQYMEYRPWVGIQESQVIIASVSYHDGEIFYGIKEHSEQVVGIEIFDMLGRSVVNEIPFDSGLEKWDKSLHLPIHQSGIYFMSFRFKSDKSQAKKFVVL